MGTYSGTQTNWGFRRMMTITRSTALGAALAMTMALAACAPGDSSPSASGTSSASASASVTRTSTPTPTPRASAIVVGMTSMSVLDAQGNVVQELSFGDPGPDVAYKLTQVFGIEPTESDTTGGLESWPTHNYNWNGFELRDELRDETKAHPYWEYYLFVTTARVNGVEIRTAAGTHVGDPAASVVFDATSPWPPATFDGQTCGAQALHSPDGNVNNSVALYLCTDEVTTLVSRFSVPVSMQI